MASSSGTSCGSFTQLTNSGSEEDLLNQKKRKRMLSNRESARRSRLRKQKHLDDLMAQANNLKKNNSEILTTLNLRTQHYLAVDSENSVLRTQMMELTSRLNSLNEILQYISGESQMMISENFINPLSFWLMNQQPIMASSDIIHYY